MDIEFVEVDSEINISLEDENKTSYTKVVKKMSRTYVDNKLVVDRFSLRICWVKQANERNAISYLHRPVY